MATVTLMAIWFFMVVGIGTTFSFIYDLLESRTKKAKAERARINREIQITGYNIIKARIELEMVEKEALRIEKETNALTQVLKLQGANGKDIYMEVYGATEEELKEIKAYVQSIKG